MLKLTQEQIDIITSTEDIIVDARAGSGKTSTLIEYALQNNRKRKLYLAFNSSIVKEAQVKFAKRGVNNIYISTVHQLAHTSIIKSGRYTLSKYPLNTMSVKVALKLTNNINNRILYFVLLKFENFCNSDSSNIDDFPFEKCLDSKNLVDYYEKHKVQIDYISLKFWDAMDSKKIEVSHSFYLKKYQLEKPVLPYDIIMLDECLPHNASILLEDGSTLPIGDIVQNRLRVNVLTYNQKTKQQEVNKVVGWSSNTVHKEIYRIIFEDRVLECTHNHKVYVSGIYAKNSGGLEYTFYPEENRWLEASQLQVDQYCQMSDGGYKLITGIEVVRHNQRYTYDITVENNHNFYANGVLVHNCQDSNDVIIDIFKNQKATKVAVGDFHQAIYGWRGAVNAMSHLPYKKFTLSTSFRFHQDIADIGVKILKSKTNLDPTLDLSELQILTNIPKLPLPLNYTKAVLSRSNVGLFTYLIDKFPFTVKYYIQGGLDALLTIGQFKAIDIYNFKQNLRNLVNSKLLLNFGSYENYVQYCSDIEDISAISFITFLHKLEKSESCSNFEAFIYALKENVVDNESDADVCLSTIHKAKGREWDHVTLISNDNYNLNFPFRIPESIPMLKVYPKYGEIMFCKETTQILTEEDKERIRKTWFEELNIHYVGVTRARQVLEHKIGWITSLENI